MDGAERDGVERDRAGNRMRPDGLTAERRELFLDTLIETGSLNEAVAAAGGRVSSWYRLRDREPEFAAEWASATEHGFETMQAYVIAKALGRPVPDGFDEALAVGMLKQRDARIGKGAGYGKVTSVKHVSITDVEDEILRRLAAIARRRVVGAPGPDAPRLEDRSGEGA